MSALPSIPAFGAWLEALRHPLSELSSNVAAGSILLAYARATARATGLDEHDACMAALDAIRSAHGEDMAEFVASSQGLDLDAVLDQEHEDRLQEERERCEPHGALPWE